MPVRTYKPTSPGRRLATVDTFEDITKTKPEKSLIVIHKKKTGRSRGLITVRHRGGGTRSYYRLVDFTQSKYDASAKVLAIEYDPNRGARLALIQYSDGEKSYILAPVGLKVADTVMSSQNKIDIQPGNRLPLEHMPIGTFVYNIEINRGAGGRLVRGAGVGAQILAIEDVYAVIKLPSGELRRLGKENIASVGRVSNPDHNLVRVGKAGRRRLMGWRPSVRGKAMNPNDHPHGGGEGHSPIGMKRPETPWGKPALGVKTRRPKKWSNFLIISRRTK